MSKSQRILFTIAICLISFVISTSCNQTDLPTPTVTPIPPTNTPTQTYTPIPPTTTPSVTPIPTLATDTTEHIYNLGAELSWWIFTRYYVGAREESIKNATELDITLSEDELISTKFPDSDEIVKRIEKDLLVLYGPRGQSLFAVEYYSEAASFQLNKAHNLEYKDIDDMRNAIELSAEYLDVAVDAAKLLELNNQMITNAEKIAIAIRGLLKDDLPKKDAIYAAYEEVLNWIFYLEDEFYQPPD